jgi:hypothetical protein
MCGHHEPDMMRVDRAMMVYCNTRLLSLVLVVYMLLDETAVVV